MKDKTHTIEEQTITLPEGMIPVMEHFYTVQGEGKFTGQPAYFIRLAGCDVGCVWCDVKESWEVSTDQYIEIDEVVDVAAGKPANLAVITGGEPLMYDLTELTQSLKSKGFSVNIETSGAYPFSGTLDWVCLSPKKFKFPTREAYARANELKVIVFNKSDFKWAEEQSSKVDKGCELYLQPEWSKRNKMMPLITEYVKDNPKWKISLQTHKYLEIP